MPAEHSSLAARKAAAEEQQAQAQLYNETITLLQGDATRAAEAAKRESLEQLRADTTAVTSRVKRLKEKTLILSAENVSKQELADSMGQRLSELTTELGRVTMEQEARRRVRQTQDQRVAALTVLFDATLERSVEASHHAASAVVPTQLAAKTAGTGVRARAAAELAECDAAATVLPKSLRYHVEQLQRRSADCCADRCAALRGPLPAN